MMGRQDANNAFGDIQALHQELTRTLHEVQEQIKQVLAAQSIDSTDKEVREAMLAPILHPTHLPLDKGGMWPTPSLRLLCDWRAVIKEMATDDEYDKAYYRAVLKSIDTGFEDIARIQSVWILDACIAYLEERLMPLEKVLEERLPAEGLRGINDLDVREKIQPLVTIVEAYQQGRNRLQAEMQRHAEAIKHPVLKRNETSRFEDEID